jgi:hypothetical protein
MLYGLTRLMEDHRLTRQALGWGPVGAGKAADNKWNDDIPELMRKQCIGEDVANRERWKLGARNL